MTISQNFPCLNKRFKFMRFQKESLLLCLGFRVNGWKLYKKIEKIRLQTFSVLQLDCIDSVQYLSKQNSLGEMHFTYLFVLRVQLCSLFLLDMLHIVVIHCPTFFKLKRKKMHHTEIFAAIASKRVNRKDGKHLFTLKKLIFQA